MNCRDVERSLIEHEKSGASGESARGQSEAGGGEEDEDVIEVEETEAEEAVPAADVPLGPRGQEIPAASARCRYS